MKILCVIPARGGSKGIPRKNLKHVGGRSLLERAISVASEVAEIDHVFVSTEDQEIKEEALRFGAEVPFLRSNELASDYAPMIPVIRDAILSFEKFIGYKMDVIILLEPTVPFRRSKNILDAISIYKKENVKSVAGVCSLERKPQNIFYKSKGILTQLFKNAPLYNNRQQMTELCRISSGFYLVNRYKFMQTNKILSEPIGFVEMTPIESINIDNEIDYYLAQLVSEKYNL
jgi:CMP-N,N'-diacetyllegionaminic acid synthase